MKDQRDNYEKRMDSMADPKRIAKLKAACAVCPHASKCPLVTQGYVTRAALCHFLRNAMRINQAFIVGDLACFLYDNRQ